MAEALYRKYRPQIFEDVVGQEQIERTIKNAIAQAQKYASSGIVENIAENIEYMRLKPGKGEGEE